jgi:hypothetical protein
MKINKYLQSNKHLKKLSLSILIGLLGLIATNTSYAMSELVELIVEPEWPTTTQPGNVILYQVTAIGREGQGLLLVSLTTGGLPEGTIASFSPPTVRFTGRAVKNQTSLLTLTTPQVMSVEQYPFTITATAQRESITVTNQITLAAVGEANVTLMLDRMSETSLRLRGKGGSGRTYQIESSPDLSNPVWTPVGTTTADGNGRFTFFSQIDQTAPMCFFRAALLPADAQPAN